MWKFSFLNFGVNLIDIATLRRSDIRDGRWYYQRSKTGTGLKNLIDKYRIISDKSPVFGLANDHYVAKIPLISPEYA